jgi:hypothetical protein
LLAGQRAAHGTDVTGSDLPPADAPRPADDVAVAGAVAGASGEEVAPDEPLAQAPDEPPGEPPASADGSGDWVPL